MKHVLPIVAILFLWITSAWSFQIQAQEPQMVSLTPDSNSVDIDLEVVLKLEFDVNIGFNSTSTAKSIRLVETETPSNIVLEAYAFNGQDYCDYVSIDNDTLKMDLSGSPLKPETKYSVLIDPGAVENASDSTAFSGIDDSSTRWRFTTVTRPGLSSKSPVHEATGVSGLDSVVLTYDEEVAPGSDKNLHIYKSGGNLFQTINTTSDAGLITLDDTNTEVTISHDAFNGNQDFYILMDEAFVTSVETGVGSAAISNETEWTFTSADGPATSSYSPSGTPGDGAHGDQPLVIEYSEPVTLNSDKNVIIYQGGSPFQTINTTSDASLFAYNETTHKLSIDHDMLPGSTTFTVYADEGLVTADDNNIASEVMDETSPDWTFTTAPPPGMTIVSPPDGDTDVTANEPLVIAFDEAVSLQIDKNLTIYNSDDSQFQSINTTTNSDLFAINGTNDTLTINHNDFGPAASYYINMDEGLVVSNETAIGSSALTGSSNWSFSTANAPTISSFQPDGETNVNGDQVLELNYSENVVAGDNKNLYIYRESDDQLFQSVNTTDDAGQFTATDTTLQISHDPLWGNTSFYILADEGLGVSTTSGMPAEGISDPAVWTFSTTGGPVAESFVPAATETNVSIAAPFMIDFNENITLGTSGNASIYLSSDSSLVENISFDSGNLTTSNDTLTIGHVSLTPETEYFINIDNGLIISESTGVPWDGLSDTSWSFTTGGAPTISGYDPASGTSTAPVNQPLTLTFNENIKQGNSGYLKIREEGDEYFEDIPFDAGRLQFSANELQISHNIFSESTTYFVTIDSDVIHSEETDVAFAGISDTTQWRFTTDDAPVVDSFTPTNGSVLTSADENLIITFDQDIQLGTTGSFRIRYTNSASSRFHTIATEDTEYISIVDSVMTISHPFFTPDTGYYVLVDEGFIVSPVSGISCSGIQDTTQWTFTAPAGPEISTYEPANNSIDITTDSILTLTFNENIARGSGNLTIHRQSDNSDVTTVSASSSNLLINNNTLAVENLSMPHETTLYVTIDAGFVQSASTGFGFQGISDTDEWVFTTLPEPPAWINEFPAFESITPDNIDLALKTNRDADYYFVVTANSVAPSNTQIMEGKNSNGNTALNSGNGTLVANTKEVHTNIDISGLNSEYHWLHAVSKDPAKELYSSIETLQIDKVPPVTTIFPSDGSTHFPESENILISFDERIYNNSGDELDDTNVSDFVSLVFESDGTSVSSTVSIDAEGTTVTVDPDSNLDPKTGYTITMNEVYDQIGNGQTASSTSTFTTDKLNVWTGSGSDPGDWSDSNNWETGAYTDNTSINIPASATTFPEVNDSTGVYNINIEPGATLNHSADTLTVNGEFRLQSSSSGNASYINTGGHLNMTSNDSVKIEQHVTDLNHVYNISSPVSGATKSNIGMDNQMFRFDNSSGSWIEMGDIESMTTGTGYSAKSSQSLMFSGPVNTGEISIDLFRTPDGLGWNLIGNPYTASIDWTSTALTKTNIVDAFWIYLNDQEKYGAYNDETGMAVNLDDPKIPSNHAFWVKVNEGQDNDTGNLTLSPDALTSNAGSYLKSSSGSKYPGYKLAAVSDNGTDETGVAFIPGASGGNDRYDTEKMDNNNQDLIQIYTVNNNKSKLCINGMPDEPDVEIPLGFKSGHPGQYAIRMKADYLPSEHELMLEDKNNNLEVSLSDNEYTFDVASKGSNNSRFVLKVVQTVPTSDQAQDKSREKCMIYSSNQQIVVETPDLKDPEFTLSDITGRVLRKGSLAPQSTNRIKTANTGMYILEITSKSGKEKHKVVVK